MFGGTDGMKSMKAALRRERLPMPPVPAHLQPHIDMIHPWCWGTKQIDAPLYDVETFMRQALTSERDSWCVIGHEGYGASAWYFHCYLVTPSLVVFVQAPWGGAMMDGNFARDGLKRRFELIEKLSSEMGLMQRNGIIMPGRLIVQQSSYTDPRWGWSVKGEPMIWNEEYANAMTPALEALQSLSMETQSWK